MTAEGWLHVEERPRAIGDGGRYGDFVLQLECLTHAPDLNSGVFFRCLPGQEMNGYESQIHNGFKDGDRSQPADCGTGGIFRRRNARRVAADDSAWFTRRSWPTAARGRVGQRLPGDRLDGRTPAGREPAERAAAWSRGRSCSRATIPTTDISFRNLRMPRAERHERK